MEWKTKLDDLQFWGFANTTDNTTIFRFTRTGTTLGSTCVTFPLLLSQKIQLVWCKKMLYDAKIIF